MTNPLSVHSLDGIYRVVEQAIRNKHGLLVTYDGKPERHLCPHVLGLNRQGQFQALCYQYDGYSSTGLEAGGSPNNWRCLPLAKITSIRAVAITTWHTAPNHSRPQTCVPEIHVEVEF